MPKVELGTSAAEVRIAEDLISQRPGLGELLALFKREASRPPFLIAQAAAVVIVRAFMLGQRVGRDEAASRVGGVLRFLERHPLGRS